MKSANNSISWYWKCSWKTNASSLQEWPHGKECNYDYQWHASVSWESYPLCWFCPVAPAKQKTYALSCICFSISNKQADLSLDDWKHIYTLVVVWRSVRVVVLVFGRFPLINWPTLFFSINKMANHFPICKKHYVISSLTPAAHGQQRRGGGNNHGR
jgi:hypothetical protein